MSYYVYLTQVTHSSVTLEIKGFQGFFKDLSTKLKGLGLHQKFPQQGPWQSPAKVEFNNI